MVNVWYLLIIFALLSIIPAGIVFVVLHSKLLAQKSILDALRQDQDVLERLKSATDELYGRADVLDRKTESVKESFTQLNAKLAARARRETKPDRAAGGDDDDDDAARQQQPPAYMFSPPQPPEQPKQIIMRPKLFRRAGQ